ncbi:MAG: DEAD/DEAH box helicase family protein [Candidatus Caldatribacteriota bacterium]
MEYISKYVDLSLINKRNFNIISSGTGTGKTWFIANEFKNQLPHIKSYEILFVASRSLIVEQQSKVEGISKYDTKNSLFIKYWNGQIDSTYILEKKGIQIMTYDKIINILLKKNIEGLETLNRVKVIIFDECHTLFSDANFIKDMEMLKVWIRDNLYIGNKIFIGLTATPNIIEYYQKEWGVSINKLNDEVLVNYKVKQLHCTDFDTIPYIVTTQIEGKTMIMCYSYNQCLKLKERIPNSFILTSKSNKKFTKEMNKVRQHIIKYESLPDTFMDDDGVEKELNVLIVTSTLREGVNLRKNSGVRNIVSCFSDELHIIQFVGRCRYSIDNLIVADTYINADNINKSYLNQCRKNFKTYMKNKENISWFDSISFLIEHDVYKTIRFILTHDEKKFINYINSKWLVPKGTHLDELNKYKIYKDEHKKEIIDMVIKCKLLKLYPSRITFQKVINLMENTLGYTIETNRGIINKIRRTYKLVIDFDESKIKIENL